MKHKPQKKWRSSTGRMRPNHTWKAPDGYKILVADRGAVSFNIPVKWHLDKFEPLELYDKAPPDDNTRLSMTFWRLPPGVEWSGLPLDTLLLDSTQKHDPESKAETLERTDVQPIKRDDLEMVWTQHRFIDPVEKREAISRHLAARGFDVMVLITMDFWVDDTKKITPVWNEVVRSLQLGRYIEDPLQGPTLH